jgi:ABC-3C biological conflict system middle component
MVASFDSGTGSEASTLFNRAFCAVVLNRACASFVRKAESPLPLTYAYIILPNALHKPTRDSLPLTTAASMWSWLRDNPRVLIALADRVQQFKGMTSAAITYGLLHSALASSSGGLLDVRLRRRPRTLYPTNDWNICVKAAEFLGRWFATFGADEATTLARWGLRP